MAEQPTTSGSAAAVIPRDVLPHPELTLPVPQMSYEFRMSVELNPKLAVGIVPSGGLRNWISFSGGSWAATWGAGTVMPGGQDTQLVDPETYVVRMETLYLLKTNDEEPAYIEVRTRGFRAGPRDVLEALQDPVKADAVDPSEYRFRLFAQMETGDQRYAAKVNHGMWVGSGMRKGAQVIYE
ncbi:hypothetical protein F4780DRAFT_781070 [Xylariomycetidae sp. FL0641]|nr:hypothetical protein F4780DRAFT_781070 [Xylariomycetidae sp. FL0641]